jgi:hypothetical protein
MQAFTDLVGTSAEPAHAFDVAELTDLTPTLDIAMADIHGKVEEASEAAANFASYSCVTEWYCPVISH